MMINHLNLVNLTVSEFLAKSSCQFYTLLDVWLIGQIGERPTNGISQLGSFLCNLSSNRIDDDVLLAQRLIFGRHRLHLLDDIGIESSTETAV